MRFISFALTCVCVFDLYLNMDIDFSDFMPFMVLATRLVVVFLNFALLLMVLFNTYPVQVGLFDIVAKHARPVILAHLTYIALTLWISGAYVKYTGLESGRQVTPRDEGEEVTIHSFVRVEY